MTARVLTGSKREIADAVTRMAGEVREAIVFVEESPATASPRLPADVDLFAEMDSLTVRVGDADFSRDSIYGERDAE